MSYTKGPWRVIYYDAGDCDHYDVNGPCPGIEAPEELDCAIVHWDGFKQKYWSACNGDQKQIEANARLIAAAPELLEALEWAMCELDGATKYDSAEQAIACFDKAHAVIAKAKGTSQ